MLLHPLGGEGWTYASADDRNQQQGRMDDSAPHGFFVRSQTMRPGMKENIGRCQQTQQKRDGVVPFIFSDPYFAGCHREEQDEIKAVAQDQDTGGNGPRSRPRRGPITKPRPDHQPPPRPAVRPSGTAVNKPANRRAPHPNSISEYAKSNHRKRQFRGTIRSPAKPSTGRRQPSPRAGHRTRPKAIVEKDEVRPRSGVSPRARGSSICLVRTRILQTIKKHP